MNTTVSEQDIFDVYYPLFKHFISMNSCIQLKKGGIVIPSSTKQKRLLYRSERLVIGFRVDFVILHDYWILCFCTEVGSDVSKRYV